MNYNFDEMTNRRQTNAMKWNVAEDELPMWVADMDFKTAPAIRETIEKIAASGIWGYQEVNDEWYQAIMHWWQRRHQLTIKKEWLIFCTGVIPAVSCAVKRITNIGDNVVVQSPVYNIFFNSIENHGRHVVENRLRYDGIEYQIDFADLEEKLAHPLTTMMILCNPHNPIGKIWSRDDLERIGMLCQKHHVVVLADEIHCDLTYPGKEYIPFASVSQACADNSITCLAATKTFNIAGLQTAAVMIANESLRSKMERGLNSDEVAEPNAFAIELVVAAFNDSEEWLEALRLYLEANRQEVADFLQRELPQVRLLASDATYLLWLDCSQVSTDSVNLAGFIRRETGLYLSDGAEYRGDGADFLRMNIACPRERLRDGLARFKQGILAYEKRDDGGNHGLQF